MVKVPASLPARVRVRVRVRGGEGAGVLAHVPSAHCARGHALQ